MRAAFVTLMDLIKCQNELIYLWTRQIHKMYGSFAMCREMWGEAGYVFLHCIGISCLAEMFPKSTAELGPARLKQPKFDFG